MKKTTKKAKSTPAVKPAKLTKKEAIKQWLQQNPITDIRQGFQQFQNDTNIDASYGLFYYICKEAGIRTFKGSDMVVSSGMDTVSEDIVLKTITDIQFDDKILVPIKSDSILDTLVSEDGGVMPATIIMVPGESGIGKTTILLKYVGEIKKANPKKKILFVSSEMNEIHMFKYSKRVEIKGVDILFLGDYRMPHIALEKAMKQGWDIVILDSFQDTVNKCKLMSGMTASQAENWLLNKMDKCRKGDNDQKSYTTFMCTQHMTKGGDYSGSTNIKHMTDAMMMMKFDDLNSEDTYVEFSKNRDGATKKRLYFRLNKEGLIFNSERFKKDEVIRETVKKEIEENVKNEDKWNELFNVKSVEEKSI